MARTHQSGRGRGPGEGTSKRKGSSRPVKRPSKRKRQKSRAAALWSWVLWVLGVGLIVLIVAGLAFAAGGYLGVVQAVRKLEAPQNVESHPTYLYSAPLGESESSRRVIGTIFGGQNRKTASLAAGPPPPHLSPAPLGESESSRRVIGTIFGGQNRKTASLAEMPPHLLNALVAKEDERFREHAGGDLWGIMRALDVDLRAAR